jgi:hypothetical protein
MAKLTVYCDDSGTDNNRVAVVAGYVGKVAQWDLFNKEWKKVLKAFRVKQMHRADLESLYGEFSRARGWNERRRKQFLIKLHRIIKRRTVFPIGSAIIKADFESVIPDDFKRKFGGVYGWGAHECIAMLRVWCEKSCRQHTEPINWIFEAGTKGHGQVGKMLEELYRDQKERVKWRIGDWSFNGKEDVPLQSADVLAYELFKHAENQVVDDGRKRGVRTSLCDLMSAAQHSDYLKYWDKERLTEWLNMCKERTSRSD